MEYYSKRRFLVSFDTSLIPQVFCDVLVIGSGVAGLRAALAAAERAEVLVVAKDAIDESNTAKAQGGIACAMGAGDSVGAHAEDTLTVGHGLCNPEVVRGITEGGPTRVRELIAWGGRFDKENGNLAMGREGGHGVARVIHAFGDATGSEVANTLIRRVRMTPGIRVLENAFVLDLVTTDEGCLGALLFDKRMGQMLVRAKQTILASGGCGQIFRETTNSRVATGDGIAMAYRAGAAVCDLEFCQFHPTALYIAGASRSLISEAVRGEGGVLLNAKNERFMPKYHARGELAPRDAVSRAIVAEIRDTGSTCAYLDMRHIPSERLVKRFPGIRDLCAQFDIDIARDLVPIRPAAHYMVGGIQVGLDGRTNVARLFACGEVACTGLHGANRLASNSLLEGLVVGCRAGCEAGLAAATDSKEPQRPRRKVRIADERHDGVDIDIGDVTNALRGVAWRDLGIERDYFHLEEAVHMMRFWGRYVMNREFRHVAGWELQNMLLVARLMARAAELREESRGVHFRTDFPDTDDANWRVHLLLRQGVEPERIPVSGH